MWQNLHKRDYTQCSNDATKKSDAAKNIKSKFYHVFSWVILCNSSQNYKAGSQNLEAQNIALLEPNLNEKKDFEITLFRNDVT